jgi:hypothetical protein
VIEKAIETARNAEIRRLAGKENIELARAEMLRYFGKLGVSRERIEAKIGKPIDEAGPNDLTDLRATATAIKDRMTTIAEAFPEPEEATQEKTDRDAQIARKPDHAAEQKPPHRRGRRQKPELKAEAADADSVPPSSESQGAASPEDGYDFEDAPQEVGYPTAASLDALANSPDVKSVHPAGTAAGQGNGENGSIEAMMQSEKYEKLSDLRRTDRALYDEAKAKVLGGRGPRTVDECARLIRYIEQAMR